MKPSDIPTPMSRVHHVFVRDRETGVWSHETAFSTRQDALDEAADYRDKPTTRAVRVIAGPGKGDAHLVWIARELDKLNAAPIVVAPPTARAVQDAWLKVLGPLPQNQKGEKS